MARFAPTVSNPSLSTTVVLHIRGGTFADGFQVVVRVLEDNKVIHEDTSFRLPPAPEMRAVYTKWQSQLGEGSRRRQSRLAPVEAQETHVSDAEHLAAWQAATRTLQNYCRQWFGDREFELIKKDIISNTRTSQDRSVPIVIRCEETLERDILCRLPYQLWDLHTQLPNCEFALFNQPRRPSQPLGSQIQVLAIFGSKAGGLNLEQDAEALKQLERHGAQITKAFEPSNSELDTLLSDYAWDVLFFAGHSASNCEGGRIQIRSEESLSLENLRPSLVHTLSKGLKLAIFNSCDGLGIANFLSQLGVPNIIVMKEPVPDDIAGLFLTEFLKEFTRGTQLCQAIRRARRRISLDQEAFPAASWLPIAYLNPNAPELSLPVPEPTKSLPAGRQNISKRVPLLALAGVLLLGLTSAFYARRCQIVPGAFADCSNRSLAPFISEGSLAIAGSSVELSGEYDTFKQAGIEAYGEANYGEADNFFSAIRQNADQNRAVLSMRANALAALQDPESLIYRNNARARANQVEQGSPVYRIAIAAPLDTNSGLDIARGVAQAQSELISQGLNLVILIANDRNQTEQAREIAEQLSAEEDLLAVVGHYTSPNTCEALKVYSPNSLPIISPTSTMVNFRARCGDSNQMFFRTVSSTSKEAFTLVRHLTTELGIERPNVVAFYNSQESFSSDLFQQLREKVELERGTVTAFDLSAPDFDGQTLPDEVAEADAIAVLPDGGTGDRKAIAKSIDIIKLNSGNKPILAANTLYLQSVINQAKPALVGKMFMAVDWHQDMCAAKEFAVQVNQYWGGDLNRRAALAYEATQVLGYILTTTAGANVDRDYVQARLANLNTTQAPESDALAGSKISFENGDRVEITTREIVTLNEAGRLVLVAEADCSK